ncbi:hypothetical protein, partial [Ralstonia pseudosolanacearum]|uniref:hypothetical protein n=1 Tax=Ralstonia pseudosolanacearum TaxID=1310165 RepID=UPI003CEE0EE8
ALELLRRLGLAHRGRSGWLVADLVWPLCDLTDEERAEVSRRDSLMELLRGTLLLTGMLPLSTVRNFVGLPDTRHGESELTHAYVQR